MRVKGDKPTLDQNHRDAAPPASAGRQRRLWRISWLLGATLALLVGAAPAARALEPEIWISPNLGTNASSRTNILTVTGTPIDPFRCPTAADLNVVLVNMPTNSTIHLMAGSFEVIGTSIRPKAGWKLRGAGIDNTILRFKASAVSPGVTALILSDTENDGLEISDMTLDCNLQNQSGSIKMSAVQLTGNDIRLSRVKAVNWGTTWANNESFPLFIAPPAGVSITNCIIESCVVTQPAQVSFSDGATAISVGGDSPESQGNIVGGEIRDCVVENVFATNSGTGHPLYFHAYGGYCTIRNNRAINLTGNSTGIYRDSWSGRDQLFEGNVFDLVSLGISMNMRVAVTNCIIRNNVIRPSEGGCGIAYYTGELTDNPSGSVMNLILKDNIVYPGSPAFTNIIALSLNGHITATVMNNIFQGAGSTDFYINYPNAPWYDTNYPHALQLNNWSGNVNLAGTQIKAPYAAWWTPDSKSSILFTPTNAGWYRVIVQEGDASGSVEISTEDWTSIPGGFEGTDTEFWFRTNRGAGSSGSSVGEIVETRRGSLPASGTGVVTQARIVAAWPYAYVDIYIPTLGAHTKPIRVTSKGPFRAPLVDPPTYNPSTTYTNSITL